MHRCALLAEIISSRRHHRRSMRAIRGVCILVCQNSRFTVAVWSFEYMMPWTEHYLEHTILRQAVGRE
jgi:hypothetical protein